MMMSGILGCRRMRSDDLGVDIGIISFRPLMYFDDLVINFVCAG